MKKNFFAFLAAVLMFSASAHAEVDAAAAEAFVKKASDIHVEPYEKIFRVRLRIDGNLVEVAQPPKSMMAAVLSRLKIMSQMDISEKRKPQDSSR